ncbi:heat shock protein beta-1-like isoform X2 [Gadus macrocephalus]|uniref:heat shock protein beta-1-like isoform X2 n=1 Tax=Gadus macrocephalus TaxID=80720 RepID=UPI0028CB3ADE|nr:heat shock protein beta-1-like isoform X2 [Gadus macrocephalus]
MGEPQNKVLSRPIFRRDLGWEPFPNWTQPHRIFNQDFGLPPLLEPNDLTWIDWAKRRLSTFSWPGYTQSPMLAPFNGQPPLQRQLSGGVSEIQSGQECWRISLDVNHFSPEEIAITTKMGYLEENMKKDRISMDPFQGISPGNISYHWGWICNTSVPFSLETECCLWRLRCPG